MSQPHFKGITTPNAQCTHMTMTRLFTKELQCPICHRNGSFGWLYRCTQDREMLIEHDIDIGQEEKLDEICDLLPKSNDPKRRSPAARAGKLSLLEEISDETWKTYTPSQVACMLSQREHLLEVLDEVCLAQPKDASTSNSTITLFTNSPSKSPSKSPPRSPSSPTPKQQNKPWLPVNECMFKCCHSCRPNLRERSYLSLDGILNGDIPATAITGFGFHVQRRRIVGLIENVKDIGLRNTPPPTPAQPKKPNQMTRSERAIRMVRLRAQAGLGIFSNIPEPLRPRVGLADNEATSSSSVSINEEHPIDLAAVSFALTLQSSKRFPVEGLSTQSRTNSGVTHTPSDSNITTQTKPHIVTLKDTSHTTIIRPLPIPLPQAVTPPHPLSVTALTNMSNINSEPEVTKPLPAQSEEETLDLMTAAKLRNRDATLDEGSTSVVPGYKGTATNRIMMEEEAVKEEAVEVHSAAAATAANLITQF